MSTIHIPVREDWLAGSVEDVIDPGLPIVDPHHHLWDEGEGRYLFPELLRDLNSGHNIRATVYVQCRSMYRRSGPIEMKPVGEVEFVNGVAAQSASGLYGQSAACAGIVGFADLALGQRAAPVLEALMRAGGNRLRGIRVPVVFHAHPDVKSSAASPPSGLMLDADFREGVRLLSRFNLTLDVWAYHTQLGEIEALARATPEVTIIVDHAGGPIGLGPYKGQKDEVFADWRRGMTSLAALPNIRVKLGGLGMRVSGLTFHERAAPPSSQELADAWRSYVESAIELFGADRCMFESNFPVDKGMYSYRTFWNACKRLSAGCSTSEKAALFSGTATSVYRLPATFFD